MANVMVGLILVLVTISSSVCVNSAPVDVSILNRVGEGRSIDIHCQSRDTDLGQQTVADGSQYGWQFSVNVGGTTLFYCDMEWEKVNAFHFDAYSFQRDRSRCSSNCSWIIAEEGVYGFNGGTGFWEFMYPW